LWSRSLDDMKPFSCVKPSKECSRAGSQLCEAQQGVQSCWVSAVSPARVQRAGSQLCEAQQGEQSCRVSALVVVLALGHILRIVALLVHRIEHRVHGTPTWDKEKSSTLNSQAKNNDDFKKEV